MKQRSIKQTKKRTPPPKAPTLKAMSTEAASWVHHEALKRWEKNPRRNQHAVPKVAASIRRFGFVAPVVVWPSKNRIVAGDTRVQAMRLILTEDPKFVPRGAPGPGMVRVVFHEFSNEAEAAAYAIADNRLNEIATWDDDLLAEHLTRMTPDDQLIIGYTPEEVAMILPSEPEPPQEFQSYDLNITTEHRCPKCGYEWSGQASKSKGPTSRRIESPT